MGASRDQLAELNEPNEAALQYQSGLRERIHSLAEQRQFPEDGDGIILARKVQAGDAVAARELVRSSRQLIDFVLADYAGSRASERELIIGAAQCVIEAAKRYDPYRHGPFAEHAGLAIVDGLQELIPISSSSESHSASPDQQKLQMLWAMAKPKQRPLRVVEMETEPYSASSLDSASPNVRKPRGSSKSKVATGEAHVVTTSKTSSRSGAEITSLTPYRRQSRLPARKVQALVEQHQRGDIRAREELIRWLLPASLTIAGRKRTRAEYDDMVQESILGLLGAIDRYKPEGGASLRTFAYTRMVGAVLDHIRSEDSSRGISRHMKQDPKQSAAAIGNNEVTNLLVNYLEQAPEEVKGPENEADAVLVDEITGVQDEVSEVGNSHGVVSNSAGLRRSRLVFSLDDETFHFDVPSLDDVENDVIDRVDRNTLWQQVQESIKLLSPTQREVIELRHGFNGGEEIETWHELGNKIGLTGSGAFLRYKAAIKELTTLLPAIN